MSKKTYTSLLEPFFQDFYYELLRQKERALRLSEGIIAIENMTQEMNVPENEEIPKGVSRDLVTLVKTIQEMLFQVIEKQRKVINLQSGGSMQIEIYKEAHYVMVVLADEIFLNLPWRGVAVWKHSLLETRLFESQIAGELFFKKLETLLFNNDLYRDDLAYIYYMALSFGFKGKYRNTQDQDRLQQYQQKLLDILNHEGLKLLDGHKKYLTESSYRYTFTGPPAKGIPDVKTWTTWISSMVIIYILITYVLWYKLSADIHEALNQIFEQSKYHPIT